MAAPIALGTDNMAEDMVEVMRTALFMERIRRQDGRNPTPEQVLLWATRHGYEAFVCQTLAGSHRGIKPT